MNSDIRTKILYCFIEPEDSLAISEMRENTVVVGRVNHLDNRSLYVTLLRIHDGNVIVEHDYRCVFSPVANVSVILNVMEDDSLMATVAYTNTEEQGKLYLRTLTIGKSGITPNEACLSTEYPVGNVLLYRKYVDGENIMAIQYVNLITRQKCIQDLRISRDLVLFAIG